MAELCFEERAKEEARFIIQNEATLRVAEKHFGVSRSTISRDMVRLLDVDFLLAEKAIAILNINKKESRERANFARNLKAQKKEKVYK